MRYGDGIKIYRYYHIQITVKYRKALLNKEVEGAIVEALKGFKERYAIEISTVGFDQNHVHILCRFLSKYSGGQSIGDVLETTVVPGFIDGVVKRSLKRSPSKRK